MSDQWAWTGCSQDCSVTERLDTAAICHTGLADSLVDSHPTSNAGPAASATMPECHLSAAKCGLRDQVSVGRVRIYRASRWPSVTVATIRVARTEMRVFSRCDCSARAVNAASGEMARTAIRIPLA